MTNALDIAMARADSLYAIPRTTHPLSVHRDQPAREEIEIDGRHALMSSRTFDELAEYSCSLPTGVYDGKMWKRHDGLRIVPLLLKAGITAGELSHANDAEWAMVHTALGIDHTGPETRAMCIQLLREMER